jgi:hypothetical protein
MSATVLVSGKLWRDPERKTTKTGRPYTSAALRDGQGDDAVWWKLLAFNEAAAEEPLRLRDGDGLAASGSFKAEIYDRGSGPRIGFTVFVDHLISAKRKKREKAEPGQQGNGLPEGCAP